MKDNRPDIHEENVAGEYLVNDMCICCDMCFEIAPSVFRLSNDMAQSIVYRQPETESDRALAQESLDSCPVIAIEGEGVG